MTGQPTEATDLGEAVRRAQAGDPEAFGTLYDAYVDRIFRYVRIRVGDDVESEDLTEHVFLRAWQAIGRYQDRGRPFTAWLYTIAGNVVSDYFRSQRRRAALDPVLVDRATDRDPVAAAERGAHRAALENAIRKLTPDQQQVIILRFIEGLSPAEVAATIGKREGTVRVIQHRALAALRSLLAAEVVT
ncbi:MAG: DNA-directed RNA polymerase sigma-70 factor [Dehalococcoidia bacterium]|nr:MAG: DNA-directed RNA polymerase sigma-70 factor [Dehalococcoidia bacterium]